MIISRTPFRVSLFGGGTDFPAFFERHGGITLSTTIQKYCYISIHKLSPFFKHRFRASYAKTESVISPEEFEHPLIRECLLFHKPPFGLEISHVSDLPGRTGLGSSSAFTVGLLHALHAMHGERVTAEDLAREAIHVERDLVKDTGGWQDQYAAAYGGFLKIDYGEGEHVAINRLALPARRLHDLEDRILIYFTGLEQSAEMLLREQNSNSAKNEQNLLRMKDVALTAEKILISNNDIDALGELLHEAWMLKQTLAAGVSNSFIDDIYRGARKAGATGGKLLGGGGRGFLLLWVPEVHKESVKKQCAALQQIDFVCSNEGSRIIFEDAE